MFNNFSLYWVIAISHKGLRAIRTEYSLVDLSVKLGISQQTHSIGS